MLSCPERGETLRETLTSLQRCGWPLSRVLLDDQQGPPSMERFNRAWLRMLGEAALASTDFVLLLEDDLIFGYWFAENLLSWPLLREPANGVFFGSLYNHGHARLSGGSERHWVADPHYSWGSQALVLTPRLARFLLANWSKMPGNADQRMPRLAAAVTPVCYHRPSLVQHARGPSTWGAMAHEARDFELFWRAKEAGTAW